MKQKETVHWRNASQEKPVLHERCLVLYRHHKDVISSMVTIFFQCDIHNGVWRVYDKGPKVEYWIPFSELPKGLTEGT